MSEGHDIVFYDGACGLCDGLVRFLLARDRRRRFRFAPQQGETFALFREKHGGQIKGGSLCVRAADGRVLEQSEASIYLLGRLGGVFSLARGGLLIPGRWRDAAYAAVARNRHKWFNPRSQRPVREEHRELFLP